MKSLFCRVVQAEILAKLFNYYPTPYQFNHDDKEVRARYATNLYYLAQKGVITDCVTIDSEVARSDYEIQPAVLTAHGLDEITKHIPNHNLDNAMGQAVLDLGYTGGNH